MTRSVISNFNTHDQIEDADDEDTDEIVELVRAPDRRDLWPPTFTIRLNMRGHNPYDQRHMVYSGTLIRCTASRSCDACAIGPCGGSGVLCAACTNRDLVHCLHRTPCERWTESQVDLFHRNQNDYLTDSQSGDSSASSVLVYRPPPPPHHVLPSPGSPYTSTPGERPPRGYCLEGSTSPLQPTLSNLLQHRSHPGAAALTQATSVLSGNIVSTGAAADLDPPPAYNSHPPRPPVSSTGLAGRPPRPPPPSSTEEPPPPYSLATANVSDPPPPVSRSARPRSSTVLSSIPFPTWMQGSVSSAPSSTAAVSISQPFVMPPPLGDQSAPPGPSSVSQSVRPRTSLAAAVSTPPASDSQAPR